MKKKNPYPYPNQPHPHPNPNPHPNPFPHPNLSHTLSDHDARENAYNEKRKKKSYFRCFSIFHGHACND